MNEIKVDIKRIDDYGVYTNKDGKSVQLSKDEITALRMIYNNDKIASKFGEERPLIEDKQEIVFTPLNVKKSNNNKKKNNETKFKLQKKKNVATFKDVQQLRGVVRRGKAYFIAGAVVFVSVATIANILENIQRIDETVPVMSYEIDDEFSNLMGAKSDYYMHLYNAPNDEVMETDLEVDELEEQKRIIKKYCDVYSIKYDIVYEKIAELTDNFSNEDYLNGTIPIVTCKRKQVQTDNEELLLLLTVRNIKQMPEKYDFTSEQLAGTKAPNLGIENNTSEEVICDDYHRKISYYADLFELDRCMIHAIIQCESHYESDRFVNDHNPAGMKENGDYRIFDGDEEGLIELCTELVKYRDMGAVTIPEIAQIHDPAFADYWTGLVSNIYQTALMSENLMFDVEREEVKTIY